MSHSHAPKGDVLPQAVQPTTPSEERVLEGRDAKVRLNVALNAWAIALSSGTP
eukprot:CAMPEP_0180514850 /NCGR_PEP_ID=MMETSP1036_2-20121128/52970_1 /TAXON_ID=632150 /ORGANISM="Azadinium spinosum, Strain 3D9" /LENGTH=52 /DNA_ID=CAMNT_0022526341 /DNA_START=69 /DNA_END=225 /DNA_ORIENTATION=-